MEIPEEDEKNFLLQSMADIDHGSKFEPISKFNLGFKILAKYFVMNNKVTAREY